MTIIASQLARANEKKRRLAPEVVREIRLSLEGSGQLAGRFGITADAIQAIRRGERYGKLKPDEKRAREQRDAPTDLRPLPPWHYLIVGDVYMRDGLSLGQDRQEQLDAAWECGHGRLPTDSTPACGCWPQERPSLTVIDGERQLRIDLEERAA